MYALRKVAINKKLMTESDAIDVYAQTPYYGGYSEFTALFPNTFNFKSSKKYTPGLIKNENILIEYITRPNNPTGDDRPGVYSKAFKIFDCAYYWPHITTVSEPLNEDNMVFTASKSLGAAGTRFGWALVRDLDVA